MIPPFDDSPGVRFLPPGLHVATIGEVASRFGGNPIRDRLVSGLRGGLELLEAAGCRTVYVDGSFVTSKTNPNDFDVAWDPVGVDSSQLDPIFWSRVFLAPPRRAQKQRFGGEFLPLTATGDGLQSLLEYFQGRRDGGRKGIVIVNLELGRP